MGKSETLAEKHIEDLFEDRARSMGGGDYAIAFALMQQTRELSRIGRALENLGNGDASTHLGAIEGLSMQIVEAAKIVAAARSED